MMCLDSVSSLKKCRLEEKGIFIFYITTKCNDLHKTGDFNKWFHANIFHTQKVIVCITLQIQHFQRLPEGQDLHHHPKGWCRAVHGGNRTLTARCHHDCAQSNQGGESFISCYKLEPCAGLFFLNPPALAEFLTRTACSRNLRVPLPPVPTIFVSTPADFLLERVKNVHIRSD